jgi:hypothetical protein
VVARIRDELRQTTGGRPPGAEHLGRLEYLDAPVRESLRVRTIFPFVVRLTRQPFRAGGRESPPGVVLCPCNHLVHRRPDLYPDPERFRPERFLERRFAGHEWFPFGGDNWTCLGMAFALYEMKVALGTLLAQVVLARPPGRRSLPVRRGMALAPDDGPVSYLTYSIWNYSQRADNEHQRLAWAAAFVRLAVVMILNVGIRLVTGKRVVSAARADEPAVRYHAGNGARADWVADGKEEGRAGSGYSSAAPGARATFIIPLLACASCRVTIHSAGASIPAFTHQQMTSGRPAEVGPSIPVRRRSFMNRQQNGRGRRKSFVPWVEGLEVREVPAGIANPVCLAPGVVLFTATPPSSGSNQLNLFDNGSGGITYNIGSTSGAKKTLPASCGPVIHEIIYDSSTGTDSITYNMVNNAPMTEHVQLVVVLPQKGNNKGFTFTAGVPQTLFKPGGPGKPPTPPVPGVPVNIAASGLLDVNIEGSNGFDNATLSYDGQMNGHLDAFYTARPRTGRGHMGKTGDKISFKFQFEPHSHGTLHPHEIGGTGSGSLSLVVLGMHTSPRIKVVGAPQLNGDGGLTNSATFNPPIVAVNVA